MMKLTQKKDAGMRANVQKVVGEYAAFRKVLVTVFFFPELMTSVAQLTRFPGQQA